MWRRSEQWLAGNKHSRVTGLCPDRIEVLESRLVPASPTDFTVSLASYLGGNGNDSAAGVEIAPDGTIVWAGTLANGYVPTGVTPIDLAGGGAGAVVRFSSSGDQILSMARLGTGISDIDVAPDGTIVVAATGLGTTVLNATGTAVVWTDARPNVERVSIGTDGTVAALTTGNWVYLHDASGSPLGSSAIPGSHVEDLVYDASNSQVIVTGYNQLSYQGVPVQVAWFRAYTHDFMVRWRNYDWTGNQVGGSGAGTQGSSMADTRGYRVAIGRDGFLYFAGESAGGNTTFRYDPKVVDRVLSANEYITTDQYNHAYNTGSNHITFYGRFELATGNLIKMQGLLARLSSGRGNTIRPRAITADEEGRVYVSGITASAIENRDTKTVNGQLLGPYQSSEGFVYITDFTNRLGWTVFTAADGAHGATTGVGIATRNGLVATTMSVANNTGNMLTTTNALQPTRNTGHEAYLAVWGQWPAAPPTVAELQIALGESQRSTVRSLTVAFDREVVIDVDAFQLTRQTASPVSIGVATNTTVVAGRTIVTLTFVGPDVLVGGGLSDGNYQLRTRSAAIRDVATGVALDGDNDGLAGGDHVDTFFRFFGDSDGDRDVDVSDLSQFRTAFGSTSASGQYRWWLDETADGDVDISDLTAFRNRFGRRLQP